MTNRIKNIVIVGSDARQSNAFSELCQRGYKCNLFGNLQAFDKEYFFDITEKSDAIILPLPSRTADGYLNCTLDFCKKIRITELLLHVNKKCLIIGSKFSSDDEKLCKSKKIRYVDIYEMSDFVEMNTKISAEGALFELMSVIETIISQTTIGIVGYGRLGSQMATLFLSLGAKVTVMARREESLNAARAIGCDAMLIEKKSDKYILNIPTYSFDAFFNTVEHPLFTAETQKKIKNNPIFFELASGKGGYSEEFAANNDYRIIRPGSLPLKYAVQTAATEYTKCIKQIIEKGG